MTPNDLCGLHVTSHWLGMAPAMETCARQAPRRDGSHKPRRNEMNGSRYYFILALLTGGLMGLAPAQAIAQCGWCSDLLWPFAHTNPPWPAESGATSLCDNAGGCHTSLYTGSCAAHGACPGGGGGGELALAPAIEDGDREALVLAIAALPVAWEYHPQRGTLDVYTSCNAEMVFARYTVGPNLTLALGKQAPTPAVAQQLALGPLLSTRPVAFP